MRECAHLYADSLREQGLDGLEAALTTELSRELRLSPDSLTIRYPLWLINHLYHALPEELRHRVTMVSLTGHFQQSVLMRLNRNDTVLLWLIETMARQYPAFAQALHSGQLNVLSKDNTRLLTVEFRWDPSRFALHDAV